MAWFLFVIGLFCLVAPQTPMRLTELKFLYKTAFAGEVILGMLLMRIAYYLIRFPVSLPDGKDGDKH